MNPKEISELKDRIASLVAEILASIQDPESYAHECQIADAIEHLAKLGDTWRQELQRRFHA